MLGYLLTLSLNATMPRNTNAYGPCLAGGFTWLLACLLHYALTMRPNPSVNTKP